MSLVTLPGNVTAYRCDGTDLVSATLPKDWRSVRTYHGGGVWVIRHYSPSAKVD